MKIKITQELITSALYDFDDTYCFKHDGCKVDNRNKLRKAIKQLSSYLDKEVSIIDWLEFVAIARGAMK